MLWNGESCRVNITLGPKEERLLMTGLHTVADIYCTCCNTVLGWKYVRTPDFPVTLSLKDSLSHHQHPSTMQLMRALPNYAGEGF